jgi:hypothetical protein
MPTTSVGMAPNFPQEKLIKKCCQSCDNSPIILGKAPGLQILLLAIKLIRLNQRKNSPDISFFGVDFHESIAAANSRGA